MKIILIGCFLLAGMRLGATTDNSSSAAGYLSSGVGARFLGMGSAGVALVDDVTATFWNPAGLTRMGVHPTQIGTMYSFLSLDRSLDYLGFAQHTQDHGEFGLSVTHYGVQGIESYDNQGNPGASFDDQELSFSLSWGNTLGYQFRYGTTARALYHGLGDNKAYGYGMDFGFMLQPSLASEFTLAANLQNPAGSLQWDTGRTESILPNLKLGMADRYLDSRFALAADLDIPFSPELPLTPHFGAELWLLDSLAARIGLNRRDFTAGATWKYEFYQFDYAYVFDQRSLGDSHQVSLILLF